MRPLGVTRHARVLTYAGSRPSRNNCPRAKPTIEDRGSPTLRFGKALNFPFPFCVRHLVAWPATLHIILKNDAKSSFFKPCCNLFDQCLHMLINPSISLSHYYAFARFCDITEDTSITPSSEGDYLADLKRFRPSASLSD